jgi:hypothetical protein
MLAVAVTAAIVMGDHVALRASPERRAAQQAVLWKGDWLEVRGARKGWLKVYDHRHERPGWIADRNARVIELDEAAAPSLRAIVEFLRDAPGSESLGIAYAAMYLKVAPRAGIDASILVSIGTMADHLARRASTGGTPDGAASEQLEVAQSWGIRFASLEQADGARVCYDGDAFRQALAMTPPPSPADAATAVLALTDPACTPPTLAATERQAIDEARVALLEKVDPTRVPGPVGDALRIRRAQIDAQLAWAIARRGEAAAAAKTAGAAFEAFARVDKAELADDDVDDYQTAALQVAASQWAAAPAAPHDAHAPALQITAGDPGQTCISILPAKGAASPAQCTHGQVWPTSYRVSATTASLAVEPLPGWLELWLFRRGADGGWMVDVLTPSTDGPDLGYVELAGWSPDHARALIVREARTAGSVHRSYEIINAATLAVEKQASTLAGIGRARAWATADWRSRTMALR